MTTPNKDELAVRGFADGSLYNAARPDYPSVAIEHFVSTLGIMPTMHVLDLGAGTGIFTRQILPYVEKVTAVDPSSSMRASLREETHGVEVLEGSDVAIPLGEGVVDAVFVAQAFHWFDASKALAEIHRVLVPGGALGLIWNERDETVAWVEELSRAMRWDIHQPYRVGTDFSDVIAAGPFEDVARVEFKHTQTLTREGLYQRVLTTSYISLMSEQEQDVLMRDVALVVERQAEPITLPYVTSVYTAKAALHVG
ncbi:MAG TPA: methyltransferase domain-containing protein [Acidimicrobiales bacterium]|jgi:ubiquinone/menaquinone biosynthesis C-methylase UbiE|nr:methyltransferase domain-containing protein [Acidimicrobiales bacterium]